MKIESRIEEFRKRGFGLFVHYGPYVQYRHGEWAMNLRGMDQTQYEKQALEFDYSSFDVKHLIRAAKISGAQYITFTTRHHDGFSLYDTRGLSGYDIMHTPNGRDIVKEFADACHENDIMPFFYHTTLDWHNPNFKKDFSAYQQYLRDSIQILCENYGEVGGFWLDGNWSVSAELWDLDALYGTIRKYQPNTIIINNTGLEAPGIIGHREIDCVTFEQGIPQLIDCSDKEKQYIGEMCYPLCEHWGIAEDINIKSMGQILEAYTSCRKVGGNFLLGIFTKPDGSQPLLHQGYLEALGLWMKRNKAALHNPKPGNVIGTGKDFWLEDGRKKYAFIHNISTWGDSNVLKSASRAKCCFENVSDRIVSGCWLDNGDSIAFTQEDGHLTFEPGGFLYGESWIVRVAEFNSIK